jgi:hypothetical protein
LDRGKSKLRQIAAMDLARKKKFDGMPRCDRKRQTQMPTPSQCRKEREK